jgi:hypothetical protein
MRRGRNCGGAYHKFSSAIGCRDDTVGGLKCAATKGKSTSKAAIPQSAGWLLQIQKQMQGLPGSTQRLRFDQMVADGEAH